MPRNWPPWGWNQGSAPKKVTNGGRAQLKQVLQNKNFTSVPSHIAFVRRLLGSMLRMTVTTTDIPAKLTEIVG